MEEWQFISLTALVASMVAAIVGTGGGIILFPVLIEAFGVREAIPMSKSQLSDSDYGSLARTKNRCRVQIKDYG